MKYIKSSKIYFEDGLKDGYLVIDQGKIVGYLNANAKVDEYEDYGDNRIIPGIIDTHNHGTYGYGCDKVYPDKESLINNLKGYLHALTYEGVTSCFPTITCQVKEMADIVTSGDYRGARVMGLHSEGPYVSRVGEGGRPEDYPAVDMEFVKKMWEDSKGLLKLFAMAPEIKGTDEILEYLIPKGVKIAYAHSDCKREEAQKAVDAGYRVATHTANVMVGIHHRDIGGLGVMLMDPRVQCEVICDGLHVSLYFIEMMFKIKDKSQFMMISDSATLAGIKPGRYETGWFTPINVTDEGFVRDDDGRLLGSSKSVLYGVGNLVEKLHIPLEEVIKLSSLNAAKYYGFADRKGSIAIGKDADFVVISDDYKALSTYVEGDNIYNRQRDGEPIFNPHPSFVEEH